MFIFLRDQIYGGLTNRTLATKVSRGVRIAVAVFTSLLFLVASASLFLYAVVIVEVGWTKRIIGGLLGLYILVNWIYLLHSMFRR